jgi:hypothetical protein
VTVTYPPITTLASVMVRYNAGVEGRAWKSVSNGTQEVEDYFTGGLFPSTPVPNFIILHHTGRECDVSPHTEVYESVKVVPIVSGATAWTDEGTALTYILVINECLWMPDTVAKPTSSSRHGGTRRIGLLPSRSQCTPMARTSASRLEQRHKKNWIVAVTIPMYADGTNICIKTRTPTQEELDCCNHIHLTSDREWELNNVKFPEIATVRRDVDAFRRDNAEDLVPGEIYNVDSLRRRLIAVVESPPLKLVQWYVTCMHRRHFIRGEEVRCDAGATRRPLDDWDTLE